MIAFASRAQFPPGTPQDRFVRNLPYVCADVLQGGTQYRSRLADGGAYEFVPHPDHAESTR